MFLTRQNLHTYLESQKRDIPVYKTEYKQLYDFVYRSANKVKSLLNDEGASVLHFAYL